MRRMTGQTLLLAALVAMSSVARAQDTTRTAAISIFAAVSAREVRFAKQPTIKVTLAHGTIDSIRVLERRNLPEPVQPGATYRDVYVSVEILGRINAQYLAARITRQTVPACSVTPDSSARRSP
jgi:hypothetical protein